MKSFPTSSTETKIYRDRSIILWPTGNNLAVSVHFQLENVSPREPVALFAVQKWVQRHKKMPYELAVINLGEAHLWGYTMKARPPSEQKLPFLPLPCTPSAAEQSN